MSSGVNGYDLDKVIDVFERYEHNPDISGKMKNLGFHLSVCPGPGESMDEPSVLAFICEHMKNLGYENQPYVVYRHNDIEREHYHVVSVRVDENGKAIGDSFSHLRALESLRELAPKYGFHIGADPQRKSLSGESLKPAFLDMNKDRVMDQVDANFNEALEYEFDDFAEFAAVMRSWGIAVSVSEREDEERRKRRLLRFKALDREGRSRSRYLFVNGKADYHVKAAKRLEKAILANSRVHRTEAKLIWLRTALQYCYQRATCLPDLFAKLSSCGISPYSLSKGEKGVRKSRRLTNVILVDQQRRIATSLPRLGGSVGITQLAALAKKGETKPLSREEIRQIETLARQQVSQIQTEKNPEGKEKKHTQHL